MSPFISMLAGVALLMAGPSPADLSGGGQTTDDVVLHDVLFLLGAGPQPSCDPDEESLRRTSLRDLQAALEGHGVRMTQVRRSLAELEAYRGVRVLQLRSPGGLLVVSQIGAEHTQVVERGLVTVASTPEFAPRYSGRALVAPGQGESGAAAHIAKWHHDLGTKLFDEVVRTPFTVRNAGTQPLVIGWKGNACGSCGAPEVRVMREVVPPGQSTTVDVAQPALPTGSVYRQVFLLTNDLAAPVLPLSVHAWVPRPSQILPAKYHIRARPGDVVEREMRLMAPVGSKVLSVRSASGLFDIEVGSTVRDSDEYATTTLRLRHEAGTKPVDRMDALIVRTSDKYYPVLKAPVRLSIEPSVQCAPTHLTFSVASDASAPKKRIRLRSVYGEEFAVTKATATTPVLEVRSVRSRADEWCVDVVLSSPPRRAFCRATITIHTDVPGQPVVKVPVYIHTTGR